MLSFPDGLSGRRGETVTVPVQVSNGSGVVGVRVALEYPAETLSYVPGSAEAGGATCLTPVVNDLVPGRVIASIACVQSLPAGPATALSFGFTVHADAPCSPIALRLDPALCRLNDGMIPGSVADGQLDVICDATPTAVPTAVYPEFDLDGDGWIDADDLLRFMQEWQRPVGDAAP